MMNYVQKLTSFWGFLAIVLAMYAVTGIFYTTIAYESLLEFVRIFSEIAWIIVLVFGIIFLTNLLIGRGYVARHLGKESGARGWLMAIVGGILASGPPYLWYPVLSDLKEQGMKNSLVAAFLYSRAVKIPFLPVMIYYFGLEFTVVATVLLIVFSVLNGIAVERITGG
jgi:uncharacterized membrane protein YraQ (UPF0718 family)